MNEFEQRLRQVPLKPTPADWRAGILAAAKPVAPSVARGSWFEQFHAQFHALLWPHPKAWAGLAAIWIFIVALNLSQRDGTPLRAEKSMPPSPEVLAELRQQQQLLVEMLGKHAADEVDRPRIVAPQPRTQWVRILMV